MIEGESLLNDGTALVLFEVLKEIVEGKSVTAGKKKLFNSYFYTRICNLVFLPIVNWRSYFRNPIRFSFFILDWKVFTPSPPLLI